MYIRLGKTTTWQDKRINAMNRIISKNKREYKGENNGNS